MSIAAESTEADQTRSLGTLVLPDGQGMAYTFCVYPARAQVSGSHAVFGYVRLEGSVPLLLYAEAAEVLGERLAVCPKRSEALALGAIYLVVHIPDEDDTVSAAEAAIRLIRKHRPVLNSRRVSTPPPPTTAVQQAAGRH